MICVRFLLLFSPSMWCCAGIGLKYTKKIRLVANAYTFRDLFNCYTLCKEQFGLVNTVAGDVFCKAFAAVMAENAA